ncbi:MAG: Gfo/Idh/MocA family oxidoreductase, partial [Lentisphaerota bacterium]
MAHNFAEVLRHHEKSVILAVGSRSRDAAQTFAKKYHIPLSCSAYKDVANNGDIDAIFIATPPALHKENSIICLRAGKAVLCEKPFTLTASEAKEVILEARRQKRFCMEAMWTRFVPIIRKIKKMLDEGAIGETVGMFADFGIRLDPLKEDYRWDSVRGGGVLLDLGVYPVSLAHYFFGKPERISSYGMIGSRGVDEQVSAIFGYPGGIQATLFSSFKTDSPQEIVILGTRGMIRTRSPIYCPLQAELLLTKNPDVYPKIDYNSWKERLKGHPFCRKALLSAKKILPFLTNEHSFEITAPFAGDGHIYEIEEVERCIRDGKTESDIMPLDETLRVMESLDVIRGQWGTRIL